MSSPSLIITYTGPQVPDNPYWLTLEEMPPTGDITTVQEAAKFLDKLFDRDPCVDTTGTAEESGGDSLGLEGRTSVDDAAIDAAAQATLNPPACDQVIDGSYTSLLHIARSHQTEDYRLYVIGGEVSTTEPIREMIKKTLAVEAATSIELDRPVIGQFAAEWQGGVISSSGAAPAILRNGNVLYWAAPVTGTLVTTYLTSYDAVTVRVAGRGEQSVPAKVVGVYHGLVVELETTPPKVGERDLDFCDPTAHYEPTDARITCYHTIALSKRCQCSHQEVDYLEYDQETVCPEWITTCPNGLDECTAQLGTLPAVEYVFCADDNAVPGRPGDIYAVSSPDYYRDVCCETPPSVLPRCLEMRETFRGGMPITLGPAYYRGLYGPQTRIVPVSPVDGICGEHITRQIIRSTCCEGVPTLAWDASISPETMEPNSSVVIGVTGGGRYSLSWRVIGQGFQFMANGSQTMTTRADQPQVYLSALVGACGTAQILVTDGCSTVGAEIRCTAGRWQLVHVGWWPDTLIDPGGSGLFLCSSYGYPYEPGYTSILSGRWYVGPYGATPPAIAPWTYLRESHVYGLWASESNAGPVMVEAPGTRGSVRVPALVSPGVGTCVRSDGSGEAVDVHQFWFAPYLQTWEWVC